MFCCKRGAEIYLQAKYCHNCGGVLPDPTFEGRPVRDGVSNALKCHKCGASKGIKAWDFGLGKAISSKRAWGETAMSAALSAVTVPLIGYGMLRLPGKKTNFRVLRLRLMLCDSCWQNRAGYSFHPFWNEANRLGFTEFFPSTELDKMASLR